ncbi:hypothetical protein [Candidatus Nitrosarchaeum limnium]|jgi:hypothetical protein|uniref:Uncharacterized protein n=1 Tax=Candidatus Nitrosarchaeum limnium BG20 TaxID=859192 RepID=S2EP51_9ARCH|nr:hypothetical protein [Candidatus Nitrosarchaeum limnium]EPA06237.1 hypothetical protein BG20_I0572 [Candidatus Nitrosarchaeum limnium BG20]
MFEKHRKYFMLNKNILIAFTASITVSAIVAQMLSDQADYLNTTYTLAVDYIIYFSTFGGLYYLDNRKKYLLESGQTDKAKLKHDLIKIVASLGVAEVVYTIVRWILQYYFLMLNYDAYLASIVSQVISTIIYMIIINLSVKMTRLYKDGN